MFVEDKMLISLSKHINQPSTNWTTEANKYESPYLTCRRVIKNIKDKSPDNNPNNCKHDYVGKKNVIVIFNRPTTEWMPFN